MRYLNINVISQSPVIALLNQPVKLKFLCRGTLILGYASSFDCAMGITTTINCLSALSIFILTALQGGPLTGALVRCCGTKFGIKTDF